MTRLARNTLAFAAAALLAACGVENTGQVEQAAAAKKNGTTLAATKTLDICANAETWTYSGEISVWNEGAIDTVGLVIQDFIQYKAPGATGSPADLYRAYTHSGREIPAGTLQANAVVFPYSFEAAPLDLTGTIRNSAVLTILNHSGSLGEPKGPNPKATWMGGQPPPCEAPQGCVLTHGYWGSKPGVVWPTGYDRSGTFFQCGLTWQEVVTAPGAGNGYFILGPQYIAAVLNGASGAAIPAGVRDVIAQAAAWFGVSTPATCATPSSCGVQRTWAGILDSFNNGTYPGGPPHCAD